LSWGSYLKLILIVMSVSDIYGQARASAEIVIGDVPLGQNPHIRIGRPLSETPSVVIISRQQYVISWDFNRRIPEWAAWTVSRESLGDTDRSTSFRRDRDLDAALSDQNQKSVSPDEYKNSCLDRGHQVASADRTSTPADNMKTFFMSNVIPQSAYLNRNLWASLERFVRRRVSEKNEIAQIYVGYAPDPNMRSIGPLKDIHVPAENFKIVVLVPAEEEKTLRGESRFFVVNFPNITSRGTNPVDDFDQACEDAEHKTATWDDKNQFIWKTFLSTRRQVEIVSGLSFDFLSGVHEMNADEIHKLISEQMDRIDNPVDSIGARK
jgi:endonuclease G, mitochondrial